MVQTLACNVNNNIPGVDPFDIYLDANGGLATASGQQYALEACVQAANTLLGECVLNTDIGIPYFQSVWTGSPNIQLFESKLRAAFLGIGGGKIVTEIVSLTTSLQKDVLTYQAIIKTIYGASTLTGVINA